MVTRAPRRDIEHQEQVKLFGWAAIRSGQIPELDSLYAVPNGSNKSKAQAGRFRAEGLKSGVPDVVLPCVRWHWRDGRVGDALSGQPLNGVDYFVYGGLYIEMKSPDNYPTPNQREWADRLERQGMKVIRRCTSWQDAAKHCLEFLGIEVSRKRFPELFVD